MWTTLPGPRSASCLWLPCGLKGDHCHPWWWPQNFRELFTAQAVCQVLHSRAWVTVSSSLHDRPLRPALMPHVTEEQTEAPEVQATCLRSNSLSVAELSLQLVSSDQIQPPGQDWSLGGRRLTGGAWECSVWVEVPQSLQKGPFHPSGNDRALRCEGVSTFASWGPHKGIHICSVSLWVI